MPNEADTKWWRSYRDRFPQQLLTLVSTEDAAIKIMQFQNKAIPTLLQTPEYARAVMLAFGRELDLVERALHMRMRRQTTHFADNNRTTQMSFIIDESAVLRPAGDDETMAAQRAHLAQLDKLPNVSIRIVPLRRGVYPELSLSFSVHVLSDEAHDRVAYNDNGETLSPVADVSERIAAFRRLSNRAVHLGAPELIHEKPASHNG